MFFKISALVLLAAFYACYFIKMFGQRKKGIKTSQIGKGKTGKTRTVEYLMSVSTFLVVIAEVTSIICGTTVFPLFLRIIGLVVAVFGVAVFIAAVVTMRDSWRVGVPEEKKTKIVTTGIFSVSRNPAFLGFDLLYLGILLMFFNPFLLIFSLFSAVMLHLQTVVVEEPFLREAFGKDYENYAKKVCRYLGKK